DPRSAARAAPPPRLRRRPRADHGSGRHAAHGLRSGGSRARAPLPLGRALRGAVHRPPDAAPRAGRGRVGGGIGAPRPPHARGGDGARRHRRGGQCPPSPAPCSAARQHRPCTCRR
ncbi:MAG: hypothetical protein AVDCRST_MAG68-1506, partial [uncultured Gemmatimonadetes bacterium]